jgi:hypothetical protein
MIPGRIWYRRQILQEQRQTRYLIPGHVLHNFTVDEMEILAQILYHSYHRHNIIQLAWSAYRETSRASQVTSCIDSELRKQLERSRDLSDLVVSIHHQLKSIYKPLGFLKSGSFKSPGRRKSKHVFHAWVAIQPVDPETWIQRRTWLNAKSPVMPGSPRLRRVKASCHFAATWERNASVAIAGI